MKKYCGFKKLLICSSICVSTFKLYVLPVFAAAELPPPPEIDSLVGVVSRIVGMFIAASVISLIIIIAYGIIKASLSAGDPRGLEGAKSTWSYAMYGFFIVFFSFVIVSIIWSVLGIGGESPGITGFLNNIIEALGSLIDLGQEETSGY